MKDNDKNSEWKTINKILTIVIVFGCAATILFVTRGCRGRSKVKIATPYIESYKYDIFVEDWNRAVINANLNKFFYLPDVNPEGVISRLNALVRPLYKVYSPELQNELKNITQGKKYSFFVFYASFLETYCITTSLIFDVNQTSAEIRNRIKQIAKQDRINTKSLAIIASIDNPCLYIDLFREDLYEKGMSRNIQSCKDIEIDKSKYPLLQNMLHIME